MDLNASASAVLEAAGYRIWSWFEQGAEVIGFEDECSLGFLFVLPTAKLLLESHKYLERSVLSSHKLQLQLAGDKAWNVYTIFVTAETTDEDTERAILQLEEDLELTRKVARAAVADMEDLVQALLPLLPITSRPELSDLRYADRIMESLSTIVSDHIVTAFLADASPSDIAQMLARSVPESP